MLRSARERGSSEAVVKVLEEEVQRLEKQLMEGRTPLQQVQALNNKIPYHKRRLGEFNAKTARLDAQKHDLEMQIQAAQKSAAEANAALQEAYHELQHATIMSTAKDTPSVAEVPPDLLAKLDTMQLPACMAEDAT